MPEITETAEIPASADTLWNEIGGFDAVDDWHPMLEALDIDRNEGGHIRIACGKDGSRQVERLTRFDPSQHSYEYMIERSSLPVRDYSGKFSIDAAGPGASRVRWSARFDLAPAGDGKTIEAVRQFLHAGLASLQHRYGAR